MKTPKLKKVSNSNSETKIKVENIINRAIETDYINSYPIEDLTLYEIDLLAEYARENNVIVSIRSEYSNFHQGVLVGLIRKDNAYKLIKYI